MFSQEREGRRKRGPSPRHLHLLLLNQVFALVVFLSLYESLAFTPTDSRSHSGPSFPTRKGTTASCEQYLFGSPNIFTQENRHPKPAFLIERIGYAPNERVFRSIAELCINVFFKESLNAKPEDRIAPWKETQIGYLKALQTGDLRRRRELYPRTNEMFLAYEVKPAAKGENQPLILDLNNVFNLPSYARNQEFVRGEILGFCEITKRAYGIGQVNEMESDRPVLTNLAVSKTARELGIGSKLLDECERHVAYNWKFNEIILEVDDYNAPALDFYGKRGYDIIFSDPASRRYDVSGFFLKKVRCTRRIMRKVLALKIPQSESEEIKVFDFFFTKLMPKVGA